jgi:hypothetical protein
VVETFAGRVEADAPASHPEQQKDAPPHVDHVIARATPNPSQ